MKSQSFPKDLTAEAVGLPYFCEIAAKGGIMRRALAVVTHGGRLWFLGGMDENDEPSLAVDWHDPKTGEWGKGPDLPKSPMAGFG
ncbi:MAG: hypothetical protein EOP88_28465, partial [Verrucomicrobiaceae bacterium]